MKQKERMTTFERRVYESQGFSSVCGIGPVLPCVPYPGANHELRPVKFHTSAKPDDLLRSARMWNWQEIDLLAVVHFGSLDDARRVKAELDREMSDDEQIAIRRGWFDLSPQEAERRIVIAADMVGALVLSDETRRARFEQAIRRYTEKARH